MESSSPTPTESAGAGPFDFRNLPLPAKYNIAARQMANGLSDAMIVEQLIGLDVAPEQAALMVAQLRAESGADSREDEIREAAQKDMLHGGLWCGGGLLVTGVTYALADGGGGFVMAWGAVIFGAIQFFRGLRNSRSGT